MDIKFRKVSVFFVTLIILFYALNKMTTDWLELSSSERKLIQVYKKETGADYIYCMRVVASKESYDAIIKKRKLTTTMLIGKHFSLECKNAQWWDIADYEQPEYSGSITKDSLDLITRINGVIYFTSEVW
jgi:hypothetical protein